MTDKQYLTKERLEELKEELVDLRSRRRIEVGERLKRAKELGDLSENSEYFEAREEQQWGETRISELEDITKNAVLINPVSGKELVQIGATIEVSKDGKVSRYTNGGADEARPENGMNSN